MFFPFFSRLEVEGPELRPVSRLSERRFAWECLSEYSEKASDFPHERVSNSRGFPSMQSRAKSKPLLNVDSWVSYPYVYAINFTVHFMQLGKHATKPSHVPGQTELALRPLSLAYSRR